MKKIFALIAATVVIASASYAQTDTSMHHKSMHHTMHKSMHKSMKSGDSTTMHHSTKKPM